MKDKQGMNLVPALQESLIEPLEDTAVDIAEVFLDTVFEDGILKDIPIIGTLAAFTKVGISLRERNLAKNTYAFILGFRKRAISTGIKNKYRERMKDPKAAEKELGYALTLLDRETQYQKAVFLGRAYRAFVDEAISWDKFVELSEAISRMFMIDFKHLLRVAKGMPLNCGVREDELYGMQRLEGLGLISEIESHASGTTFVMTGGYKTTSLGRCLISLME